MKKLVLYLLGIGCIAFGTYNFFSFILKFNILVAFLFILMIVLGIFLLIIGSTIKSNNKTNSQDITRARKTQSDTQKTLEVNITSIQEKKNIDYKELDINEVINRFLNTSHGNCPEGYDRISYLKAEFECLLNGLRHVNINLSDTKVLRNSSISIPFEKTKNITASTRISRIKDFISIDVETTGLKTGNNDIIEISAIKFNDFKPVEIFTTLLKPRKPIPPEVTAINGITDEMVKDSPTFSQIHDSLKNFLGNYNLVAHNAVFDIKFLYVSGLDIDENKQTIYDTLQLSKWAIKDWDNNPLYSYKLQDVCSEVEIHFDNVHRSSSDALATGLLFNEIVKIKKDIDSLSEAVAIET